MLTSLNFQNFKSWKSAAIKMAPITALFGTNSSGKSSISQFLLMLKQTKDSVDRSVALEFGSDDSPADLGSFHEAVYRHDDESAISWDLNWTLDKRLRIADPSGSRSVPIFEDERLGLSTSVRLRKAGVSASYLRYHFAGAEFSIQQQPSDPSKYALHARSARDFRFIRALGRKWDLPPPTRSYAFPDQARTYYQNSQFLSDFETEYAALMDSILHLGPLREPPKRQYSWAGSRPLDVGPRGERTVEAILAATSRGDKFNLRPRTPRKGFQEMIAWWLAQMGLIDEFRVDEIAPGANLYRAIVKRDAESTETYITDVGFGISQVLPVLVLLHYAPEGSIIIFEQPEIHLHPAVQSSLADLFVTTALNRNLQIVIESHSEHLLMRLLRRLAEGDTSPLPSITPEDVALYFTDLSHGDSTLERLKVNLFGGIENWPRNFFGDPMEDVAAREEAAISRRVTRVVAK